MRQAEGVPDRQVVMNASRPQMLIPAERCESFTQAAQNDAQDVHRRCGTVAGWPYRPSHRLRLAVVAESWGAQHFSSSWDDGPGDFPCAGPQIGALCLASKASFLYPALVFLMKV